MKQTISRTITVTEVQYSVFLPYQPDSPAGLSEPMEKTFLGTLDMEQAIKEIKKTTKNEQVVVYAVNHESNLYEMSVTDFIANANVITPQPQNEKDVK